MRLKRFMRLAFGHVSSIAMPVLVLALLFAVGLEGAGDANAGEKLNPGDSVSQGMQRIRTIIRNNHSLITHRRLGVHQAHEMAGEITSETDTISRAAGVLSPEARVGLSGIVSDLKRGATAVRGEAADLSAIDGLVVMDEALARYGSLFDDPE